MRDLYYANFNRIGPLWWAARANETFLRVENITRDLP